MRLIVDTNIVFSGILNSASRIGNILINPPGNLQLLSCEFLRTEIFKHRSKLLHLTGLPNEELDELERLTTGKITFFNEAVIPIQKLIEAEHMLIDINPDDIPFVALALAFDAKLWTGDKVLVDGLRRKGFNSVITTAELSGLFG